MTRTDHKARTPSTASALASVSEVGGDGLTSSAVIRIDDAYQEYCRRCEAGEALDPRSFFGRFQDASGLIKLMQAEEFLENNPQLLVEDEVVAWPECGTTFLDYKLVLEL